MRAHVEGVSGAGEVPRAGGPPPRLVCPARLPCIGAGDRLLERTARRLRLLGIVVGASFLLLWLAVNLLLGAADDTARPWLAAEFGRPGEWVPPVVAIVASLLLVASMSVAGLTDSVRLRVGLVYEVTISVTIACATYLGAFAELPPGVVSPDRIGLTFVGPWLLLFSVLVPAPPREAAIALLLSSLAVPVVYLLEMRTGTAPWIDGGLFLRTFVLPYVAAASVAWLATRVVHDLGREVRAAAELGSYRLEERIGRGGMGEVWRASHRTLARPAAIKLIRTDPAGPDSGDLTGAVRRFEREARVIATLQSPHTVALYDFGVTEQGTLYYAMELLDGIDLETVVERHGPLPPARVVRLLRQICASLAEAHARGVVHRDIKPANLFLCRRGIEHDVVKVLDFGLARPARPATGGRFPETAAGVVAGTPHYLAPEVALGLPDVDGRADLYAVGCVAFWLLCGRRVFPVETTAAAIAAHVLEVPPAPGAVAPQKIPRALDLIVLDCLAKDPAMRPAHAAALAGRLSELHFVPGWGDEEATGWWERHYP